MKLGFKRLMLPLLVVALVAGCASRSADHRISIQPGVNLSSDVPRLAVGDDKLLRVSVRINNSGVSAVKAYLSVDWLDGRGQKVESLVGSRAPLAVAGKGYEDFSIVAPRTDIIDFRMRIESRE